MKEISLKEGERLDDLERNNLFIIQNPNRFCFGMDAVLLSGYVSVGPRENVMDLGTGNGILPILLSGKTEGRHFTGIEIQEESADMARRSVELNGLEDRIEIVTGDFREAPEHFGKGTFDVVVTNPPYMGKENGLQNPKDEKAIAKHEIFCELSDVLRTAAALLKVGGRFYMVHRPFRLPEIMTGMVKEGMEPKRLRLVYPFVDKEPNMVLIEGRRGGKPFLTVEKPLILYREPDVYTDEIRECFGY